MDFSQLLTDKADIIVDKWVDAVRQDKQVEATNELTYKAVRDSLPLVLEAMATVLSQVQDNDVQTLVEASLTHGNLRAEQGFEPAEIAREYRLLRDVVFSTLEADLLKGSAAEVLRAARLVDAVIDEAIARCFDSYTKGRLQELEQMQSQLRLTNQELTRLVQASKTNLSHLAHELKTPLTSIIGYADLFLRQQHKHDAMRDSMGNLEHIERVLRSSRELLHLINDALEISRYEAGQMKLHPMLTVVPDLVSGILEMIEPLARAKDLQLIIECDRAPTTIVTDPLRLKQVITNLLSNAVRYTETGSIRLECQTLSEQQWAIAVIDTGVGIEPKNQKQIFEPYFQAIGGEQAYVANSTGLGLAIVSRLVKLLQGKIELSSEVGVGSTFTVTLPLKVEIGESTSP